MTVPTLLQQRCIASRPSPPALPAPDAAASKIQPEAQQHLVRSGAQHPETVARTFVLHLQAPARQSMRASVLIMAAMQIDSTTALRCVIVPGNGCTGRVADANWYGWLENELKSESQFREVVLPETMPDPVGAKESVWVPFMRETLKVGPTPSSSATPRAPSPRCASPRRRRSRP